MIIDIAKVEIRQEDKVLVVAGTEGGGIEPKMVRHG